MTVGGGFTGLAISFQLLLSPQARQPASFVLTSVSLALFAFVTFSGLLFVHNAQRTRPMVVAMALQVPRFSSPLVAYKLSAGFQLVVALMGGRFNTSFRVGSDFQLNLLQQLPWGAGVNLFALLILILLLRCPEAPNEPPAVDGGVPSPLTVERAQSAATEAERSPAT
jgi:hypothetical protein